MKVNNKIEFIIPDRYFKNPSEDPIIGFIKYLREQGKTCEFLGLNEYPSKFLGFEAWHNNYVILIDGIKYYGRVGGNIETNYYATFFVVDNTEQDYIENLLDKRVNQILNGLKVYL